MILSEIRACKQKIEVEDEHKKLCSGKIEDETATTVVVSESLASNEGGGPNSEGWGDRVGRRQTDMCPVCLCRGGWRKSSGR